MPDFLLGLVLMYVAYAYFDQSVGICSQATMPMLAVDCPRRIVLDIPISLLAFFISQLPPGDAV